MAKDTEPDNAGKPAKGAPVIRQVEVAQDDMGTRVLNRHVPAFVISGACHVVIIAFCWLFFSSPPEAEAKPDNITTATVTDPPDEKENLTNEDIGLDPALEAAVAVEREENVNVEAKVTEDPVGVPNMEDAVAPQTAVAGPTADFGAGSTGEITDTGTVLNGLNPGGGSLTTVPGMLGRSGSTKNKLLEAGGGNTASEAAVARGLAWLARKQLKNGSWEFDGSSKDKIASTGLALLPFLAAGETHKGNGKYRKTVDAGLKWLMDQVGSGGAFNGTSNMYAHAIGCVALCEAAGMTKDPLVKAKATAAIGVIVRAQGDNGSWGYSTVKSDGDTSIVGWQVQALASAKMAEIKFDKDKVFKSADRFLENVSEDSGSKYGYRTKGASQTLTPVGLLSRYYMGSFGPRHPAFGRGVEFLKQFPPRKDYFDMYYYYYATQVVHFYEGPDWHKFWNPKMRDMLIEMQNNKGDENLRGSWEKDSGFIGSQCGRLGTTCLALLTLEVYYRHLPLYKRDNAGLVEIER